ncbi:YeeE/YedE family protein [Roseovarius sp. 2305UL8-3]|uniref:YeeE/YedE family protein n=1 Tax=Roseovarius conchicola TaxID=3121636 RepID=UPI00352721D6
MIETLIDTYGDGAVLMMAGALVGLIFGAAAQHSRFCLRAASVEVSGRQFGPRLSIWLIAFCTGVAVVQAAIALEILDVTESRQLSAIGSLSGAIIGGLMFGCGMILARGCASRLLILSATGNLRAVVSGLVLTLVAQSALRGVLSPAREGIGSFWTVNGGEARDILALISVGHGTAAIIFAVGIGIGLWLAISRGVPVTQIIAGAVVGLAVALGWMLTYQIAHTSFEVVAISSVTFTGPSADTLMGLVNSPNLPLGFGVGLVPGVFIGAAVTALLTREFQIQRFGPDTPMERYLIGATLMGFGSMLAGGCAVGAGMSGGAVFSLTAWVAVFFMWIGAMLTHVVLSRFDAAHGQALA